MSAREDRTGGGVSIDRLASRLAHNPERLRLRQAVVTAVTTGPAAITVRIGGSTVDVPGVRFLDSYTPAVADSVWLLQDGPTMLALGRLAV